MVDDIRSVCDTPLFYSQHFIGKKINFLEKSKSNSLDYQNLLRIVTLYLIYIPDPDYHIVRWDRVEYGENI